MTVVVAAARTARYTRGSVIDPDRWRSRADGPRWLYAAPGQLRAPWRLIAFGLALLVLQPIAESVIAPLFRLLSAAVGEPVAAYPWITMVAVWAAVAVVLRMVDDAPWSAVALSGPSWHPRRLASGAALGVMAIGGTIGLLAITGHVQIEAVTPLDGAATGASAWMATALRLAVLLAPAALWEELVFRGYLWTVAETAGGVRVARYSTALAFGLVHLQNPGAGVWSLVLVTVAGLCLGAIREQTGSLAAAWMAHLLWNWTMAAVLHVPVSGLGFDAPGYRTVVDGPEWWTGGAWGPEGGGAALLLLGGAWWLSHRWMKTRPLRTGSES